MENNNSQEFDGRFLKSNELLAMAWGLYKSNFWKIFTAFVLPFVLLTVIWAVAAVVMPPIFLPGTPITLIAACIVAFVFNIAATWQGVAVIYLIDGTQSGLGIKDAYLKAGKKIFSYWWLMILEGLVVMGAFVPLIIPGFILSVWFMFAPYVLVLENAGGLQAMLRSRDYVKGRVWAIMVRQGYLMVILMAVFIPLMFLAMKIADGNKETMELAEGILNLIMLPIMPLFVAYFYLIYKNLKALHPEEPAPIKSRWPWYLLAGWGVVISVLMIGVGAYAMLNLAQGMKDAAISTAIERQKPDPQDPDVWRLAQLRNLQGRLEMYFQDKQSYPDEIADLKPGYWSGTTFSTAPIELYTYVPAEDRLSYELCVDLTKDKKCVSDTETRGDF